MEIITLQDISMCMFTAARLTIAKKWNQPKGLSRIDWIKKMWDTYTMKFYVGHDLYFTGHLKTKPAIF